MICLLLLACAGQTPTQDDVPSEELCDGQDRDLDGLVDCRDLGCLYTAACDEVCTDGRESGRAGTPAPFICPVTQA